MKISLQARDQLTKILPSGSWMRISVQAGGCNGFEKLFSVEINKDDGDIVVDGQVVVDNCSYELIANSELDWVDDLSGSQFVLTIPEAVSNCGCGRSFAI